MPQMLIGIFFKALVGCIATVIARQVINGATGGIKNEATRILDFRRCSYCKKLFAGDIDTCTLCGSKINRCYEQSMKEKIEEMYGEDSPEMDNYRMNRRYGDQQWKK